VACIEIGQRHWATEKAFFASFILGMGMTITACYIFLALVLAPALVMIGLNEISVHLFLLCWGMLSFITPTVALAAYPGPS